ncbi:MAG: sensor histidine kinase [Chloroflexi bacterium]|nr:sensor histidine kinase [Chloroflexota bacterium]
MVDLRLFFTDNRPLIYFVYGQVFFVMGVAILLQSRRYSRLDLARSLPWLAAFAIIHSLNEWGDLFIPIQADFDSVEWIQAQRAIQLVMLAGSFACLMQFGVDLLRPLPRRWAWLQLIPAGLLLLWLVGPFVLTLPLAASDAQWYFTADSLARYFIGFPASALAAISLRRHARLRIAPLNMPVIYNTLRVAGLALAAYAVVSGLIAPPAPFFPASVFNGRWVTEVFVLPPPVFRSIAALILAVTIIRALEVFEVETDRLIEQMEQAQVIAIEREHIGRELHDGAIQQLYAAGLLATSLRKKADGTVGDGLDRLILTINETIAALRHFLTDLRSPDAVTDLPAVITAIVNETRRAAGAELRWEPCTLPGLPADRVTHVAAFTREALSNAMRHAHARVIELAAQCDDRTFRLIVRDDGRGFSPDAPRGYGLRHMRDRARLLGGHVTFESAIGRGTIVTLTLPLERDA